MEEKLTQTHTFSMIGGTLALDFANTVGGHITDHNDEYLTSYPLLVSWGRQAGVLTEQEEQILLAESATHPEAAQDALERGIQLRETIFRIFTAIAQQEIPAASDVATFNIYLEEAMHHLRLVQLDGAFAWSWENMGYGFDRMLWPVTRSAAELLVSGELSRVRTCANDTCGWLFMDTSKNRSRRWCDMNDCGNRAKARRHYARKRAAD